MNLLTETKVAITESGHTIEDIIFIGSVQSGHSCSWEEFKVLADVEYHNGYGAAEVATDLKIVFNDGTYMWRGEYDGSEGWEYCIPLTIPKILLPITNLVGGTWDDLEELNKKELP